MSLPTSVPGPRGSDGRVVWRGRDTTHEGLDDWSTSPASLHEHLAGATELVVLDALSFPWQALTAQERTVPLAVTLPPGLDAGALSDLLGEVVLAHLTPADRVLAEPAVRRELERAWQLDPGVWLTGDHDDQAAADLTRAAPDVALHTSKVAHLQLTAAMGDALAALSTPGGWSPLTVCGLGRARQHLRQLQPRSDASLHLTWTDEGSAVSPDVAVLAFADGEPAQQRASLLREARDLLHPGGHVLVSAYVVSRPGRDDNPRISALVEELWRAFGTMVTFDDVRSLRLAGDPHSRVVHLTLTSLWPRSQ